MTRSSRATGLKRIDAASASRFDVVLLDIGLPTLDGYEVARRLRALAGGEITLIAITGWGQSDDLRRARRAGFDAHLTKPVDYVDIAKMLNHVPRDARRGPRSGRRTEADPAQPLSD